MLEGADGVEDARCIVCLNADTCGADAQAVPLRLWDGARQHREGTGDSFMGEIVSRTELPFDIEALAQAVAKACCRKAQALRFSRVELEQLPLCEGESAFQPGEMARRR
ncbi:MAG: hypothetical protein BWY63_03460 [Chloroflexi bacterium ADurb.Bin360]|nr:MAG: hypothetical protein BWY63_03460 [Chloroflexi bacterium ADurb.Bin360]